MGYVYFVLLAVQFGLQPTLNKLFIPPGISSTLLIALTELIKIVFALGMLYYSTRQAPWTMVSKRSMRNAFVPAALYSLQNWLIFASLQYLSPLSLSLLNQTKTLSAAFFAYWILDRRQSKWQIVGLIGLMLGASLIVLAESPNDPRQSENRLLSVGVPLVGTASLLSGLSSAFTEIALRDGHGNNNGSMVFSMELAVISLVVLFASVVFGFNPDSQRVRTGQGLGLDKLTMGCLFPLLSSAMGGILVGLVTQRFGGVKKGFALILGICLAAVVEASFGVGRFTSMHLLAVGFVCMSMWLYFSPPTLSSDKLKQT
ncbi:hypothetical protein BASA81_006613 [Batrachochytrium salamandrivorans]|nr:hypothetical protein BASA81_006613 [Batrachochytrium salamandrivorans]